MLNVLSRVLRPPYLPLLMGNLLPDGSEVEDREWAPSGHLRLAERCSPTLHSADELISDRRKRCHKGETAALCVQMGTVSLAAQGSLGPDESYLHSWEL